MIDALPPRSLSTPAGPPPWSGPAGDGPAGVAPDEVFSLPAPDFWRREAAPVRGARYLAGIYAGDGRLTLILDAQRLLHSQELRRVE